MGAGAIFLVTKADILCGFPAVDLQVPVSSTFLNGYILCDVTSASASSLTCITRPSLSADASGLDPLAMMVRPQASEPAPIRVSQRGGILCFNISRYGLMDCPIRLQISLQEIDSLPGH